jgi:PAS domain S-box-containing protein
MKRRSTRAKTAAKKRKAPAQQAGRQKSTPLQQSEEMFRLLVSGVKDYAIFMLDPEGNIVSWNAGAERIKGYRGDEIIGQHMSRFYPDEDKGKPAYELEVAAEEGRFEDEGWRLRKDGSRFWANVIITTMRDEKGRIRGFSKVTRDLTERKLSEEMLRHAQDQLVHAQRMGAMAKMAGDIAKDFSERMTTISRHSKFLMENFGEDYRLRGKFDEIRKVSEEAAVITNHLLAFSSSQVLNPKLVDLNAVVSGIRGSLQWLLGKDIELSTILSPALDWVRVDPQQIEKVVVTLVSHARDAMKGRGSVSIETANVKVNQPLAHAHGTIPLGRYVMLTIGDSSRGLDKDTVARIFEPFFNVIGEREGDAGLGLSTVYGIVHQSGGYISVRSEIGQGTMFMIYLPRVLAEGTA